MSSVALSLVLVAAVLHACWNMAAKKVTGDGYVFVWAYSGASALLWIPSAALFAPGLSWVLLGAATVSGGCHVAYGLALQTGYRRADLGVVYPVARGTGPLLTVLVAVLLLGERPTMPAALGAVLVLTGVTVVATGHHRTGGLRAGLFWGGLTGATIATYTLWDDHAVTALGLTPLGYFAGTTAAQTILMSPGLLRRRGSIGQQVRLWWRQITIVAVLSPLAYLLVLQAMRSTPVALVAPARESSIVIGALLAWRFFDEQDLARRLVGAAIVLGGITILALT